MFDMGFLELLVIAIIALLVLGPERLPKVIKGLASWTAKARFFANNLKDEFEREANLSEMRAQLQAQQAQFRKELENVEGQLKENLESRAESKLDSAVIKNTLDESGK